MKLKSVCFKGYKSYQEWQEINFDNKLMAVTGKNGVGKTNLLEALQLVLTQDDRFTFHRLPKNFEYKMVLELSKQELNNFDSNLENTLENRRLEVSCNSQGDSLRPRRIHSRAIVNSTKCAAVNAQKLLMELKQDFIDYQKLIKEIINTEPFATNLEIGEVDLKSYSNYSFRPNQIYENLKRAVQDIEKLQSQVVADDESIYFLGQYQYNTPWFDSEDLDISLKSIPPVLTAFQKKYITIDVDGINKAISEINSKSSVLASVIKEKLKKFKSICHKVDVLERELGDSVNEENDILDNVRQTISKAVHKNVYFLQNISSSLLFTSSNDNYQYYNGYQYLIQAFWKYDSPNDAEQKIRDSKNKKILLSDAELKRFEQMLNDTLPNFERNLIVKVEVQQSNNGLQIILHEVTGAVIPLNESNMGRRWFFSYYFLKQCLSKGDFFLIDEPASFLHPDAQLEIFNDLQCLSQKGIQVIYTTHSPYMLPRELKALKLISVDEQGSHIKVLDKSQKYVDELRQQIGIGNLNDFLLKISKNIIFVEGEHDKACLEAFMDIFHVVKANYEIYPCYGHSVVTMGWTCMKMGLVNFKVLLDNDNNNKPAEFYRRNVDFKKHLAELDKQSFIVFVSPDKTLNEIEDLFVGDDRRRYLYFDKECNKYKVSIKQMLNMTPSSLENRTKENFRNLFAELGLISI